MVDYVDAGSNGVSDGDVNYAVDNMLILVGRILLVMDNKESQGFY